MSDSTKVTSFEGAFLLSPSTRRRKIVAAMIEELGLPQPEGMHVLAAGFIEKGSLDYFHVHIDEAEGAGKTRAGRTKKVGHDYLLTFQIRERPKDPPPPRIRDRKHGVRWAMERVGEILGTDGEDCFIESVLTMRNRYRSPLPRPIVVEDEVVPAVGAEYACPPGSLGLRRLRWSIGSSEKNMNVWLSYALPFDGDKPLRQWLVDSRDFLVSVVEGVFPND